MTSPIYISISDFKGRFTIEFKDGRYRVTIRDIILIQNVDHPTGDKGEIIDFESMILRRGAFKKAFAKKHYKIIHPTFDNIFTLQAVDSDW